MFASRKSRMMPGKSGCKDPNLVYSRHQIIVVKGCEVWGNCLSAHTERQFAARMQGDHAERGCKYIRLIKAIDGICSILRMDVRAVLESDGHDVGTHRSSRFVIGKFLMYDWEASQL